MPGMTEKAVFTTVEVLLMLVKACLCDRKDRDSRFHNCGGLVKLAENCFRARKDEESCFHH